MNRRALAALALSASCLAGPAAGADLQPYQMVRSLQLVQDRIADGDDAALPIQRRLLEIIDERLREVGPDAFADERNFRALLVYAMSGGNPTTTETLLTELDVEGSERDIGRGLVSYVRGDLADARELLASMEPEALAPEVGAFVALVRGTVILRDDPETAVRLFDQARLLSPGTLVEEAALRRSISASAEMGDTERFARASMQYVRRFLASPYASQFAEAFVSALVALHETADLAVVEEVVARMNDEQAHTIYLRIARKSAIEGYDELLDFASDHARDHAGPESEDADPRAQLYASIASVTSDNMTEVLDTLDGIDRGRLSANDRDLLDAARSIAQEVMARPVTGERDGEEAAGHAGGEDAPAGDEVAQTADAEAEETGEASTRQFVGNTRDKLGEIDRLLEENEP